MIFPPDLQPRMRTQHRMEPPNQYPINPGTNTYKISHKISQRVRDPAVFLASLSQALFPIPLNYNSPLCE